MSPNHELMKRLRPAQLPWVSLVMSPIQETDSLFQATYPASRQQASWSLEDLPWTISFSLHQGSTVVSMDFHPSYHTLLLVDSVNGEITLWELISHERLFSKPFKIWDLQACSLQFQMKTKTFVVPSMWWHFWDPGFKDASISITRVAWSPNGNFVEGLSFNKHLIHLYAYNGPNDLCQHLEIDAHVGGVNDLAFAHPNKQLCVVTCGDDKLIKKLDRIQSQSEKSGEISTNMELSPVISA
ncbi:PROTEIN putative-RELATED [Salix viminalis]|uniref:PROTEIN putative-RELATED n=1 Tax=Salix viminalis TaxID=40686 RepID=A0A9Q0SDA6_SALVM|nr:PROTEIN putative-RELATED [Salix viminalis]